MKISIIVLTYNSAEFVAQTLDSAYRQSCKEDLELIVSDDCSTDDTVPICEEWISQHKDRFYNIRLLTSPENAGVTANINKACMAASGEWIKVIAGDDILMDDCIDKLLSGAKKFGEKCSFISAQALVFSKNEMLQHPEELEIMDPIPDKESIGIGYVRHNPVFWVPAPTFMYRKELLGKTGYFPRLFRNIEDMPFLAAVLANGYRIYIIHTPVAYYRTHDKSISRTLFKNINIFENYCTVYKKIIRPVLGLTGKWDCFFAYLPLRINIMRKGKYGKLEKKARKYGKYFQFIHYFGNPDQ